MKIRNAGVLAGLTALACAFTLPAHAAGPANVTIRVEGAEQTVIARTAVRTTTQAVNKSGKEGETCSGTSAAGALEAATKGDWSGTWFGSGFGYSVERVLGETHAFANGDYYAFWLNEVSQLQGVCGVELQEGDRMLLFVDYCVQDPETFECTNEPVRPLGLKAPAKVAPGTPFNVQVVEYAADGTPSPAAGATVTGGDGPVTTDAQGNAAVTLRERGEAGLQATKPNRARTAREPVCATDGADGFCGTTRPSDPAPAPVATPAPRDTLPPVGRILGIAEKQLFAREKAPRELRGSVGPDASGLNAVKLRLTRRYRGRCWYFSPKADGFVRTRCGRAFRFKIGDRADWSYLLPERPGPGRYVLDALAIDGAFNREALARGRSRVVFSVR